MKTAIQTAKEVLQLESECLLNAQNSLESYLEKALTIIKNTKGKLIVTGVGKSGLVGAKIAATFASTGVPSFFIHPTDCMHGDLGMMQEGDSLLAISFSGNSDELCQILPHVKRLKIPILSMSANANSTLADFGDCFIDISVIKEACPLNSAPTSSTTLTMALGDVLAVCMMKINNFKASDFASFHPGGSLGRRLFVRAIDLARTKNLPIISQTDSLQTAIETMTRSRLGNVVICENEQIIGILSDGDLRRALMDKQFSLQNKAIVYANKTPKIIQDLEILASDALKLIEKEKIQVLIFAKGGSLAGLLHIHDLIEAGIEAS